jgi:nucleoside-diphosphate-sugar epimerase
MKVFVAGATGAVGRPLVPLLLEAGHAVTGMTRQPGSAEAIRSMGAGAAVADALDRTAVVAAVGEAEPDVVVHQLTALSGLASLRRFDRDFAATNRLRTEGTDNLIAAAQEAGARRLVAQSFAGWPYERRGSPVKTEDEPLDPDPPPSARQTLDAIRHLESAVVDADGLDGVVVRFGILYGPGTTLTAGGAMVEAVRRRQLPVVGSGAGIWSFTHVEDAAGATVAACEHSPPGIYNVVDDEPVAASGWIPALAEAVGAKPPRRVPTWLAKPLIGDQGISMMTASRGASNAKAKRDLGWQPRWPSWREGFRRGLDPAPEA